MIQKFTKTENKNEIKNIILYYLDRNELRSEKNLKKKRKRKYRLIL
jgi:hypothetical protein